MMRQTSPPFLATCPDLPRRGDGTIDLDAVHAALAPADLLESGDGSGWSYVVPHGGPVVIDDGRRCVLRHEDEVALGSDPFAALDTVCDRLGIDPHERPPAGLPPFTGGFVGAFAYDLGRRVEQLPSRAVDDRGTLALFLRLAEVVVAVAPTRDEAVVVVRRWTTDASPRRRADAVRARLAVDTGERVDPRPAPRPVTTSLPRRAYLDAIETVLERIAAGDVFQVNLAQRLTAAWPGDTTALYRALRAQSRAPLGAALPSIGVASISPETFLAVAGSRVTTRPIKGTRPRAQDPALDAAFADDLATSDKDRAENVMVVDLQRNDLGRVCRPGSVRVDGLHRLEAHPTVWHLVSTVRGELRGDVGYGGLLRATFPAGSITGAPKVAAMRLIERLEPVRRGWYCGAIGFLAPGAAHLSVAIRTATLHRERVVDYPAGGGIVADSDPQAEVAESLDKAAAFLRAVAATSLEPVSAHVDRRRHLGPAPVTASR